MAARSAHRSHSDAETHTPNISGNTGSTAHLRLSLVASRLLSLLLRLTTGDYTIRGWRCFDVLQPLKTSGEMAVLA